MKYLLNFENDNEYQGYIAHLREEGKTVIFYVKENDKNHTMNGDNQIHTFNVNEIFDEETVKTNYKWVMTFKIHGCSSSYNQYGSTVIASYGDPFNYSGFQMYASKQSGFYKFGASSTIDTTIPYDSESVDVEITYNNGKLYLYMSNGTVTYGQKGGNSDKYFSISFNKDIDEFSYALPEGFSISEISIKKL